MTHRAPPAPGGAALPATPPVSYAQNRASASEIAAHLLRCDGDFIPRLSSRVDLAEYAAKIERRAERVEAWAAGELVGLVAAYADDPERRVSFVTSVSVIPGRRGERIAGQLMENCIHHARRAGFARMSLRVDRAQASAIRVYETCGFAADSVQDGGSDIMMTLVLTEGSKAMRDFDREMRDGPKRRYAYGFDFDVMHPFILRTFAPFFRRGSVLELGCFKGDFTERLLAHFDDVTCVEASAAALTEARRKLGERATLIQSTFEAVSLPRRYDHIVLSHVLEHLDDPVGLLARIRCEWLADGGLLFLVCPNGNAPSRQIAVKMGLISHNSAVTPAEAEHGHRRTYTLDTLERDATAAGLEVVHRTGIFFKAFANFQWDRLLQTDIVSADYLEGCYQLGQQYPDLCASIFLLCRSAG